MNLVFEEGSSVPICQGVLFANLFAEDLLGNESKSCSFSGHGFLENGADINLLTLDFLVESKQLSHIFIQISLQSMSDHSVFLTPKELINDFRLHFIGFKELGIEDEDLVSCRYLDDCQEVIICAEGGPCNS